jgi:anti-sigma regulatory factor (Ser/Thr protein kinase)
MRDISLHLMDIVQNSIRAQAAIIQIRMALKENGILTIMVKDDGTGMDRELLKQVQNPFATTRRSRRVGLGLPLITENARRTGGDVKLESEPGKGTLLTAVFQTDNIDCPPIGDLAGTILALIVACPDTPDFVYQLTTPYGEASLDTRLMRETLQGVPLNEPEVVAWMQSTLKEEIQQVFGGTDNEIHR